LIHERIQQFKKNINPKINLLQSRSAIQIVLVPGNKQAKEAASKIQKAGYDVRAILSPSVAAGTERLRICLHNHNSIKEINNLTTILNQIL
jgi:8-amino-7-oxononanoate synthase